MHDQWEGLPSYAFYPVKVVKTLYSCGWKKRKKTSKILQNIRLSHFGRKKTRRKKMSKPDSDLFQQVNPQYILKVFHVLFQVLRSAHFKCLEQT